MAIACAPRAFLCSAATSAVQDAVGQGYDILAGQKKGFDIGQNLMNAAWGGALGWGFNQFFQFACFPAGTPVQVAEPSKKERSGFRIFTKPIEQVKEGDCVVAKNPLNGKVSFKRVTATSVKTAPRLVQIELADSVGKVVETLRATPEHPFYVKDSGWARAGSLAIGNVIVTRAGPGLTVKSITPQQNPAGFAVYNFTVQDDHNYFVGSATGGVWVHNAPDCTTLARRLLNAEGNDWVIRAEPPPGASNLGIGGWVYHDAYISAEGVVRDTFRKLGPMSVDEWINTFPHPDSTRVRYALPDELFSRLYRGRAR